MPVQCSGKLQAVSIRVTVSKIGPPLSPAALYNQNRYTAAELPWYRIFAEVAILSRYRQNKRAVSRLCTVFSAVLTFLSITVSAEQSAGSGPQPISLRFCYEDKQLLPYYTGNSAAVSAAPGATIEHLQQVTAAAGISLELVRMPWLRCLQQLADNQIDALVASYSTEREHYTMYPRSDDGKPDPSRAINTNALCLAHRFDTDLAAKIANTAAKLTIARPYGYKSLPLAGHALLVGAHSPEQALELVVSGRVDATTVTCQLNGLAANKHEIDTLPVKIHQPPVYFAEGYLMLSKQFYQQYPAVSERIWQLLPKHLQRERYLEYLAFPQGF